MAGMGRIVDGLGGARQDFSPLHHHSGPIDDEGAAAISEMVAKMRAQGMTGSLPSVTDHGFMHGLALVGCPPRS
jgi:hypothetical protein